MLGCSSGDFQFDNLQFEPFEELNHAAALSLPCPWPRKPARRPSERKRREARSDERIFLPNPSAARLPIVAQRSCRDLGMAGLRARPGAVPARHQRPWRRRLRSRTSAGMFLNVVPAPATSFDEAESPAPAPGDERIICRSRPRLGSESLRSASARRPGSGGSTSRTWSSPGATSTTAACGGRTAPDLDKAARLADFEADAQRSRLDRLLLSARPGGTDLTRA